MYKLLFSMLLLIFASVSFADHLVVAVRAKSGIEKAQQKWLPTIEYLNAALPGHHLRLEPVVGLVELTQMAGRGEFDFLLTNPSSFVEIEMLYGARALATLNNRRADTAQTRFGTVIFTQAAREDILTLTDLRDKRLMAVSEPAFGGWRVAWLELLQQGIDPYAGDLRGLVFAPGKTQQEVVYAVRDGHVDAGVVRTDQLERMAADGEIDMRMFRVLNNREVEGFPFFLSTPLYPEWPFAVMPHVDPQLAERVRALLLSIPSDSAAAGAGRYVGWVEAIGYDSVKALMQALEVGPFALQSSAANSALADARRDLLTMLLLIAILVIATAWLIWRFVSGIKTS